MAAHPRAGEGAGRSTSWYWRVGAASVLGVALVVAGVAALASLDAEPAGESLAQDGSWGVDLPDREVLDDPGTPGMACLPAGCEIWAVETPVENRPLVGDELVVVVGAEEMVAYEISTGDTRWRVPTPAGVEALSPNLVALSAHGLALFFDQDDPADHAGSIRSGQVDLYDVADGSRRSDFFDLGLDGALSASWYGDRLVLEGTRDGEPAVVGVAPDGQVVWEHEVSGTALRPEGDDVLLVTDGTDVVGLDPIMGTQRWRTRGEPSFPDGRPADMVLLLDPAADEAQLVDVEHGTVAQTFPTGEVPLARRMGPWVATGTADLTWIHDADTGQELLRREMPAPEGGDEHEGFIPLAQVSWQQVGDLMAVAWPPAAGQQDAEVVVYNREGQQVRSIDIEVYALPDLWLAAVDPRKATVFATAPGTAESQATGRTIFAIDVRDGRVEEVGQGIDHVVQHDELLAIGDDNGIHVIGPAGEISVGRARRLAAPRPLIAYGPEGLIRLNPGALGISDART